MIFLGSMTSSLVYIAMCAIPLALFVALRMGLVSAIEEVQSASSALWGAHGATPPARPGALLVLSGTGLYLRRTIVGVVLSDNVKPDQRELSVSSSAQRIES